MDTVVTGRHCHPSDKFREYAIAKVERLERFGLPITRVDIELSKERAPRQAATCERVELTVLGRGPVVRAEANAADPLAALDLVLDKVQARLRKLADRRRVHHAHAGGRPAATVRHGIDPGGDGFLPGAVATLAGDRAPDRSGDGEIPGGHVVADGPFLVREKTHEAPAMTVDQALERMELVGHDFFLYQDLASGAPSVVYRRRAYDYGVLHLQVAPD